MAGYNLDQTGDVGYCDDITVGPGDEIDLWCRWDFDERHWQRMSFAPVTRGEVTILRESFEFELWNERVPGDAVVFTQSALTLKTRLRNDSGHVLTVRPTVFVSPSRYRR